MKVLSKFGMAILVIFMAQQFAFAQDIIYKKGGEKLEVKVKEIGLDEVKYARWEDQDGILYSIAKETILKIKFENGRTEQFINDFDNPEFYVDQKKRAIKMNFFSPIYGFTELAYEQNLAPGRSVEAKLGFIGLGMNNENRESKGLYGGVSYKFYNKPSHFVRGMRYAHILKGGYLRPEIAFGSYTEEDPDKINFERRTVTFGTFMLNLGKQWVYSDIFLLDLYFAAGYGFDNIDDVAIHNYTNVITDPGFAFAMGFRIGLLIK